MHFPVNRHTLGFWKTAGSSVLSSVIPTAETGMAFQPYFFTYVGRYHAMRIMEQGLSMEEYIVQLEERNYFGKSYAEFRQDLIDKINK